jgi:hypothetical protein
MYNFMKKNPLPFIIILIIPIVLIHYFFFIRKLSKQKQKINQPYNFKDEKAKF